VLFGNQAKQLYPRILRFSKSRDGNPHPALSLRQRERVFNLEIIHFFSKTILNQGCYFLALPEGED
jgi:hypothetical protein